MKYEKICKTLDDTKELAQKFAKLITNGCFISLYGEIGAGKTAFVKLVADALDVKEKVTSPSFVILNEYHTGSFRFTTLTSIDSKTKASKQFSTN